ncbi:MAG TPA: hypothetical protein VN283_04665 [Thiobacillus sp.]|nr:hypothetical protein [Thiobacillus sp.]
MKTAKRGEFFATRQQRVGRQLRRQDFARLCDDGRLRDREALVAPQLLTGVLLVCAVHPTLTLVFAAIGELGCSDYYGPGTAYSKAVGAGRRVLIDLPA